ncbi:MAG: TetR/AcrR family transcriptional regulator [Thermoguttaceae bacterium]|jgi:AcrR family transcriptional regulator
MSEEKLDTQIRREQIAEAALELVAAQGLRRLSVAAVARRVGLVPSGIYRHFHSKAEILHAVLDRIKQRLMDNIRTACQEHPDPLECLHDILMRHIRFIREGRAIPRIIFSDDFQGGHPELKEKVLNIFRQYSGQVADIVRRGQEQGAVRGDLDPATVAMMVFGIVVPAGILWHLTEGGFDVTRHAARAWEMVLSAIVPADGKQ